MGKDEYPCSEYRVDVTAAEFGACKCGWMKDKHKDEFRKPKAKEAPPVPPPRKPTKPCDTFIADTAATEFGVCRSCGFKKTEHNVKDKKAEHQTVKLAEQGKGVAEKVGDNDALDTTSTFFANKKGKETANEADDGGDGPCANFVLDMAGGFGTCKNCGKTKQEHKEAGKIKEKERSVFAGGHAADKKRPTITKNTKLDVKRKGKKKNKGACDNYRVDMTGKNFGDCVCGFPKGEHGEKGKFAQDDDSEEDDELDELPQLKEEEIIRNGKEPCIRFELDMKNDAGGYGMCVCGFGRNEHNRKSMTKKEWLKVKESLTKPKEFT